MSDGIDLTATDWSEGKKSQMNSAPLAPTVDFGDLSACNEFDEYLRFNLDGKGMLTYLPVKDGNATISTTRINLWGILPNGQVSDRLFFSFKNTMQPTNKLPLLYFKADGVLAAGLPNATLSTDLTSYPTVAGEYLIGVFGGAFADSTGTSHTVTGSYRMRW